MCNLGKHVQKTHDWQHVQHAPKMHASIHGANAQSLGLPLVMASHRFGSQAITKLDLSSPWLQFQRWLQSGYS